MIFSRRPEIWFMQLLQPQQIFFFHFIVANTVEQVNKIFITLAVNIFQFDANRRRLFVNERFKEERACIKFTKQLPFIFLSYGRQLVEISDEQNLNTTEWLALILPHKT